ncbi:MAG TPA: hypothetical protein VJH03_08240 [Blastocatellia bacterium]|nr:hypothetical protein [Blastocatellia bacterium]
MESPIADLQFDSQQRVKYLNPSDLFWRGEVDSPRALGQDSVAVDRNDRTIAELAIYFGGNLSGAGC